MRPRVLAVEDSRTQAAFLRAHLEVAGFDVSVASNGADALRLATGRTFDVVVSDVVMPGLGGYDLCRRLKELHPELPVILVTALDDPLEVVGALDVGADSFLAKPYNAAELVGRVRTTLGLVGGAPDQPAPATPAGQTPGRPSDPVSLEGVSGALDPAMVSALEELEAGSSHGEMEEVIATFEQGTVSSLARLESALSERRVEELADVAHELSGTTASFGARLVARDCRAIERAVRAGDLSAASELIPAVSANLDDALTALRQVFPSAARR